MTKLNTEFSDSRDIEEVNGNIESGSGKEAEHDLKTMEDKLDLKIDNSGIVYLSRIPPFMKPDKVRNLLSFYGDIGKVFLAPEDPKITARRKKYKRQRRPHYTEGWVEFLDKKDAKLVAKTLNSKPIGGAGRDRYKEDLWNIKYLPKFKWAQLTEQMAYERAVRDQKLKIEMQQARRENELYMQQVGKSKMIKGMEEKKQKRSETLKTE